MDKLGIIDGLNTFKDRLVVEVFDAYRNRGRSYGKERFNTWRRKFSQFLDDSLPSETAILNAKLTHFAFSNKRGESDSQKFWREDGNNMVSYIDSLILDVENDEYDIKEQRKELPIESVAQELKSKDKVFIVHCHDGNAKERTARFVEKHGLLIGKIGRKNVAPLVEGTMELPNDISGMVYINDKDWKVDIANEMKAAGYDIDFNKLH